MNGSSAGGSRQDEKQNEAQAGMDDGSRQGRQPVFEVGDGLRQVTGVPADISRDEGGERRRGGVVQLPGQAGALCGDRGSALPRSPQRVARRLASSSPCARHTVGARARASAWPSRYQPSLTCPAFQ